MLLSVALAPDDSALRSLTPTPLARSHEGSPGSAASVRLRLQSVVHKLSSRLFCFHESQYNRLVLHRHRAGHCRPVTIAMHPSADPGRARNLQFSATLLPSRRCSHAMDTAEYIQHHLNALLSRAQPKAAQTPCRHKAARLQRQLIHMTIGAAHS